MNEVEDSNIHDRYRGAAIVLRVCLEHLVWIRTLKKEAANVKVDKAVLTELTNHMRSHKFEDKEINDASSAFKFLLDLGDTAAHYELRDQSRKKPPTKANVDYGILKFDKLSNIVYK